MRRYDPADTRQLEQIRRKGLRRDMFAAEIIGPVLMKGDNLTVNEAVERTFQLANLMLEKSASLISADMEAVKSDSQSEKPRTSLIWPVEGSQP